MIPGCGATFDLADGSAFGENCLWTWPHLRGGPAVTEPVRPGTRVEHDARDERRRVSVPHRREVADGIGRGGASAFTSKAIRRPPASSASRSTSVRPCCWRR